MNQLNQIPTNCKYSLRLEIISATFNLNLSNNDRISKAQLSVLFQNKLYFSYAVAIESNTMIFNFNIEFNLENSNNNENNNNNATQKTAIIISLIECPSMPPSLCHSDFETIPVADNYTKNIKAMSVIDNRLAAIYSTSFISVELIPTDNDMVESKLTESGNLYLKLSLLDNHNDKKPVPALAVTDSELLTNQIHMYQKSIAKTCHDNYQKARLWLQSVRQSYPWLTQTDSSGTTPLSHIKLLTEDEMGQNRFLSSFLGPIVCSRDINNPRQAARFVSLLPFKQKLSLLGVCVCVCVCVCMYVHMYV